jgi:hypothetical protein
MKQLLFLTFACLALCGCTSLPKNPVKSDSWPRIVPDYIGVTIPSDMAPLNFYIEDEEVDLVDVVVRGNKGDELHSNGEYADFDIDEWHALTQNNRDDSLQVTVTVRKDGQWTAYKSFSVFISSDSLGEWGVTYRLIPPGYETYGSMGLYQRNLSNFEQKPILENKLVDSDCMNCHTPNRTNPGQFTFHVRGEHGATVVRNGSQLHVLAPRNQDLGGSMVYPFWHPSGKYIAYSTNQTHQNFHQLRDRKVEVYDDRSDIIIYNIAAQEIQLNSIVATDNHLENYPVFSPDGKSLYFCAADRIDSIWTQYEDIKYNICRIDFDAETGRLGESVDTIVNARQSGKSANMPRLSYDGRFLLYTISDYGCFPIWHPEADLWMMDLISGENWPLKTVNSHDSESFHNWSLNSRWILFTTRRDDGLYTQLYLAHIDADGKASKPFRLPQQNPREYDLENIYSINTPEFTQAPIDIDEEQLTRQLMRQERIATSLRRAK